MKTYLEYTDEKYHKFWEVLVTGNNHTIRYGKVGTKGRSTTKEFTTENQALQDADKKISAKERKGYKVINSDDMAKSNKSLNKEASSETMPATNEATVQKQESYQAPILKGDYFERFDISPIKVRLDDAEFEDMESFFDGIMKSDENNSLHHNGVVENPYFTKHRPHQVNEVKAFLNKILLYLKQLTEKNENNIVVVQGKYEDTQVVLYTRKKDVFCSVFNQLLRIENDENKAKNLHYNQDEWQETISLFKMVLDYHYIELQERHTDNNHRHKINRAFTAELNYFDTNSLLAQLSYCLQKELLKPELDAFLRRSRIPFDDWRTYFERDESKIFLQTHSVFFKNSVGGLDVYLLEYVEKQAELYDNAYRQQYIHIMYRLFEILSSIATKKAEKLFSAQFDTWLYDYGTFYCAISQTETLDKKAIMQLGKEKYANLAQDILTIIQLQEEKVCSGTNFITAEVHDFTRWLIHTLQQNSIICTEVSDTIGKIMLIAYNNKQGTFANLCMKTLAHLPDEMGFAVLEQCKPQLRFSKFKRNIDKEIEIVTTKNAQENQPKTPKEQPSRAKVFINKEQFVSKLKDYKKSCAEWAGFRALEMSDDDMRGSYVDSDYYLYVYDERCQKGKTARELSRRYNGIFELSTVQLHDPAKFYIDGSKPIKRKLTTNDLLKRYGMIAHLFAPDVDTNESFSAEKNGEEANQVLCIDYYWDDVTKIDRTFNTEIKHLANDPHLAMYWLLHMGFTLDKRIEEVKEHITQHNLTEQLPDLQAGIEFFADYSPSRNISLVQSDEPLSEIHQHLFVIRNANLLWSIYSYDYRGGEHAYDYWWQTLTLHNQPDRLSSVRAFWFVKNIEKCNQWEHFDSYSEQNPCDFAMKSYILAMHPQTSEREKIAYADACLQELWDNRKIYLLAHRFAYKIGEYANDYKPVPQNDSDEDVIMAMMYQLRHLFSNTELTKKTAQFYCKARRRWSDEDNDIYYYTQHVLNDIITAQLKKKGIDSSAITAMKNDFSTFLQKGHYHYDVTKLQNTTLQKNEIFLQQYNIDELIILADNLENPKPKQIKTMAYILYDVIFKRPLSTQTKIQDKAEALRRLADKYGKVGKDNSTHHALMSTLITSGDDDNIAVIFALLQTSDAGWLNSCAIALIDVMHEPQVFTHIIELIPTLAPNTPICYQLPPKEILLNTLFTNLQRYGANADYPKNDPAKQLTVEQIEQLLDVCWDTLKTQTFSFTLMDIIKHAKALDSASAWFANNGEQYLAWLGGQNVHSVKPEPKPKTWQERWMLTLPERKEPPKNQQKERHWEAVDYTQIKKLHDKYSFSGGVIGQDGMYITANKRTRLFGARMLQIYHYDNTAEKGKNWSCHYYPDVVSYDSSGLCGTLPDFDFYGVVIGSSIISKPQGGALQIDRDHLPLWSPTASTTIDDEFYISSKGGFILKRHTNGEWEEMAKELREAYYPEDDDDNSKNPDGFNCIDGFNANEIYIGGDDGIFFMYQDGIWQPIALPVETIDDYEGAKVKRGDVKTIVCADDGFVYIGVEGGILKGRGKEWQWVVTLGNESYPKFMVWFNDELYFAEFHCYASLYKLNNQNVKQSEKQAEYEKVDTDGHNLSDFDTLSTDGEQLLVVANEKVAIYDGHKWQLIFDEY